jgi:thioesterase domain-containing protein/acyl carrier protein
VAEGILDILDDEEPPPLALRTLATGGDRLHRRPPPGLPFEFVNMYGPTEITVTRSCTVVAAEGDQLPSIGRPLANSEMYILDTHMSPVPVGVRGELYVGGPGLARGYLNRPGLTAERFVPNPYGAPGSRLYRTGDVVRYLPDGNIEFLGRVDHQVKIRGFRVELGEIEAVLAEHPALREAAVVAREDSPGDKRLVAYLVPEGSAPSAPDLRAYLKDKLPEHMIPTAYAVLDTLPRTPNGKLDRERLPAPDRPAGGSADGALALPRDGTEIQLVQIWERLLGQAPIGIHDSFFDVGGHSLLAVRLVAEIEAAFGQQLSLAMLFAAPTVEALATRLRDAGGARTSTPLVPIRESGARTPFFCMHAGGGHVLSYVELARCLGPEQPFFGLESPGLSGGERTLERLDEMAARYIDAIRRVQASGPYLLGGWCLGGVLAYEMARRLCALGDEVAALVVIDTAGPVARNVPASSPVAASGAADAALLRRFAWHYGITLGDATDLEHMDHEEQLQCLMQRLVEQNLLPPDAGVGQIERLLEVYRANVRAVHDYVRGHEAEGRAAYPVFLFRAEEEVEPDESDPTLGWRDVVGDALRLEFLPGDHHSIVRHPVVELLAERVREALARADDGAR